MTRLVISTSSFDTKNNPHIQYLIQKGMTVVGNPYKRKLTEEEIIELLNPDTVGLIAGVEPLTARVFAATKTLKVVSRCGTGLDSVDLKAAQQHNVAVFNTPVAPAQAVAELTLGLILAALRQICLTDRMFRDGKWPRMQGQLLAAQTVGIIGLGHIGQRVARLCQAFGAEVIAYDPYLKQPLQNVKLTTFDQLLSEADIVSLHLPYSADVYHLIDAGALSGMKPGAIVINAARGGLIDETALDEALNSGKLSAAALDAFEQEPYQGPLIKNDKVILSSHIGSLAREARQRMEIEAAENLLQGLIDSGLINDERK
jgi:D-3-phosphoglycerate dehydrogenase / 2-oxoglutarate reductase